MDPILLAIATAAAGTLAGEAAKGVAAAGRLVKERFGRDEKQELVLLRAETGKVPAETLAAAIEQACADDPEFRGRLSELVGQPIQVTQVNQAGQQVMFQNNFHGEGPGKIVQGETVNIQNLH